MLELLPSPKDGKNGWPWDTESKAIHSLKCINYLPRISIITPSYNQGQFIEETIRSVLLQNYPNLEYIIIDGGSTDNTLDVIKKYQNRLTYWISEADSGQSDAINKGFKVATGELINWICSDDLLNKDALNEFVSKFYRKGNYLYVGSCLIIDNESNIIGKTSSRINGMKDLLDIRNRWRNDDSIAQPSTLYPLTLVKQVGGLNVRNSYSMDYELWGDLLINGVKILNIPMEFGIFRRYPEQKTSNVVRSTTDLIKSAKDLLNRNNNLSRKEIIIIRFRINYYQYYFLYHQFRSFLGIKRRLKRLLKNIVNHLNN